MTNKPWLARYPHDVPKTIDLEQYQSLIDMFENSVNKYADQPAFINMGSVMTFRKLEERSRAFAAYLQNVLKLQQGDRVALMMPNLLQYPVALFGVLRAGMTAVNVNPLYTARELEHQLVDADVKTIVIVSNFANTLEKIVTKTPIEHVILTSLGQMLPIAKGTMVDFVVKYVKGLVPKYNLPGAVSFRKVLRQGRKLQYVKPFISSDDLAFLQYTGGTTGVAKGAMLTHRNIVANVLQAKAVYAPTLQDPQELIVTALPLYHVFALLVNCFLFMEIGGRNLLITNPRDIPELIRQLAKYPFTAITGVNTLFNSLLNNENFRELNFKHLKLSVGGGMSVHRTVAEQWKKITGTPLLEGYGLTESSPLVSASPYDLSDYNGCIGLPIPSTEVRMVDGNGEVLKYDPENTQQQGELQVRGPQVMRGYWRRPEATKEVLSDDGWLSTGDIITIDSEGFLRLVDRKKDMILTSGFNVYPNEIEDVVSSHEKVLEVAAIGQPHEVAGEQVKIYVVAKDPTLTKEELIAHCRIYMTGYKIPRIIEFKDELPKSNVGKILRRVLRDENDQRLMNVAETEIKEN